MALAYYAAAKCGLQLALVRGQVTPLWPPTGIAVFCMLVFGYRIWPGVVLGALAVNAPIGPSVPAVCMITAGNTLAPLTSVALMRRLDLHLDLSRLRDAAALVFPGALGGMLVSATIGTAALVTNGAVATSRFWSTWSVWWTGDAMGVLVFTPLLLAAKLVWGKPAPDPARVLEGFALVVASGIVSILVFRSTIPISFLTLPLLVYAALRFQLLGTAPAIAVVSVIAVVATANSWGSLAQDDLLHKMLSLQAFNGAISLTALFLSAMATERNASRRSMETVAETLHEDVRIRTQELATAVQRLQRSEAMLEEAQKVARAGSLEWIRGAETSNWSKELFSLFGLQPTDDPVSHDWFLDRVHPGDRSSIEAAIRLAHENHVPFVLDHRIIWPDGNVHWLVSRGTVVVGDAGQAVRLVVTFVDIDDRKRAEDAMRNANEEARRANAAKSEFLSRMSHELRTPLNAIIGFSSLLMYEELSARHREMLEMIEGGGSHLLALINDVLDISRIEAGNVSFVAEDVVVADVVNDAYQLVEILCNEMSVSVSADIDPGCVAVADRTRLRQVMLNLISNAAKYNKPGGSITISSRAGADTVRIAVADTGAGLDQALLGELFTPFARLGAEFTKIEGTGLGLTVSRAIVEEMGGSLTLESTGPNGSVFVIDLKRARQSIAAN